MGDLSSSYLVNPFFGDKKTGLSPTTGSTKYDPEEQIFHLATTPGSSLHLITRQLRGDFILSAQVAFVSEPSNTNSQLGWLVQQESGGPSIWAAVSGDGSPTLRVYRSSDILDEEVHLPINQVDVIQLERKSSTYILSAAHYGDPFNIVHIGESSLGDEVTVGLFISSANPSTAEQGVFRNVRVTIPAAPGFNRSTQPFASRLEILDLESGHRQVVAASEQVLEAPNWTRDGRALIYNCQGHLYRFDLETRSAGIIDTGAVVHNNNDHVISFDGKQLAISSHSPETHASLIYTVSIEGGQPHQVTPVGPSYLHGWSPDGNFLVYTAMRGGDYDVYRVPSGGGEEVRLTTAPGLDDGPEYTPDGKYIYFNSVRSGRMQIWRMLSDGSQQEQLTDDEYNNWFPHISPNGQHIAFLSYLPGEVDPSDHPPARRVYLRLMPRDGVHSGQTPRVIAYLYGGQGTMNVPSWSPDGSRLAFVSNTVPF